MGRIAIGIAGVTAGVLVAAVLNLWTLDADQFRAQILAQVERYTGRQVTLDAPIELSLSLHPKVVLHGFTLSGATAQEEPLVSVGRLSGETELLSLLSGELAIHRLEIEGAEILLSADPDGGGNWVIGSMPTANHAARTRITQARITDSRIRYRNAQGGLRTLEVDRLELNRVDDALRLAFDLEGRVDGVPVNAHGEAGLIAQLLRPTAPFPVAATVSALGLGMRVTGSLEQPLEAKGLDLQVAAAGPDLAPLAAHLGYALPRRLPLLVKATVKGDRERIVFPELAGRLGDNRMTGMLEVSLTGPRPQVTGSLHAERLDVLQLLGAGSAVSDRHRLFSSKRLDLALLRQLDARIEISGERVRTPLGTARHLLARAVLRDGELAVTPFDARLNRSRVSGKLYVGAAKPDNTRIRLDLDARRMDVASLFRRVGAQPLFEGQADLWIAASGHGRSLSAIAGNLDGRVKFLMGQGRGRLSTMENLVGGVTKLLGDGGRTGEWTDLNCMAIDFAVANGVAKRKLLLLDTESVTVLGQGSIDLRRERLDLELSPRPKTPTLNLALGVDVSGTLLQPVFTTNVMSAARVVAGLVGGLLFPPAVLAAFADLGSGDAHPCRRVQGGTPGGRGGAASVRAPQPTPVLAPAPESMN
jgi:uncharacterized protein involved in outer membrane biogenesis